LGLFLQMCSLLTDFVRRNWRKEIQAGLVRVQPMIDGNFVNGRRVQNVIACLDGRLGTREDRWSIGGLTVSETLHAPVEHFVHDTPARSPGQVKVLQYRYGFPGSLVPRFLAWAPNELVSRLEFIRSHKRETRKRRCRRQAPVH
jgi:hypothetical protein